MSKKFFIVSMFPYPSGDKLHIGHWYNYAPVDTYARYKRLKGYDVFQPMGFDSFGLPAENYAIEHGVHPRESVRANVNKMLEQFDLMYTMYDGIGRNDQPLMTSEPEYYKWTQWLFAVLAQEKLVVKKDGNVNWCPKCQTVLANEQVKKRDNEGYCDRCDEKTVIKKLDQWYFKITEYKEQLLKHLESQNYPKATINAQKNWIANLKDWCISRQRYWGCPIPVYYNLKKGSDKEYDPTLINPNTYDFPWLLPDDVDFKPDGTSPLARSAELKERVKKKFGKNAEPEFDTMDTFVCSSFYWLQYLAAAKGAKGKEAVDAETLKEWMPIDLYVGGAEHACMHLIYARFITMVLKKAGIMPVEEPFKKLIHQGVITRNGVKMSKSKGNAVDPTEYVEKYGTDAFRMALMFMGPYEQGGEWSDSQLVTMRTFLDNVREIIANYYAKGTAVHPNPIIKSHLDRLAENVDMNTEKFKFNVCIGHFMKFIKAIKKEDLNPSREQIKDFLVMLWAYAPKTVDELWKQYIQSPEKPQDHKFPIYENDKNNFYTITVDGEYRGRIDVGDRKYALGNWIVDRAKVLLKLDEIKGYALIDVDRKLTIHTK